MHKVVKKEYHYIRMRRQQNIKKYVNLELKYPLLLSDLNQIWKVSHILVELPKVNFRDEPFCSSVRFYMWKDTPNRRS